MKILDRYGRETTEDDVVEFDILTPTDTWTLAHNQGKRPSSVRLLVDVNGVLTQFLAPVHDVDLNTTVATWGANYAGKARLGFR